MCRRGVPHKQLQVIRRSKRNLCSPQVGCQDAASGPNPVLSASMGRFSGLAQARVETTGAAPRDLRTAHRHARSRRGRLFRRARPAAVFDPDYVLSKQQYLIKQRHSDRLMADVFISYSRSDSRFVGALRRACAHRARTSGSTSRESATPRSSQRPCATRSMEATASCS